MPKIKISEPKLELERDLPDLSIQDFVMTLGVRVASSGGGAVFAIQDILDRLAEEAEEKPSWKKLTAVVDWNKIPNMHWATVKQFTDEHGKKEFVPCATSEGIFALIPFVKTKKALEINKWLKRHSSLSRKIKNAISNKDLDEMAKVNKEIAKFNKDYDKIVGGAETVQIKDPVPGCGAFLEEEEKRQSKRVVELHDSFEELPSSEEALMNQVDIVSKLTDLVFGAETLEQLEYNKGDISRLTGHIILEITRTKWEQYFAAQYKKLSGNEPPPKGGVDEPEPEVESEPDSEPQPEPEPIVCPLNQLPFALNSRGEKCYRPKDYFSWYTKSKNPASLWYNRKSKLKKEGHPVLGAVERLKFADKRGRMRVSDCYAEQYLMVILDTVSYNMRTEDAPVLEENKTEITVIPFVDEMLDSFLIKPKDETKRGEVA